MSSPPPASFPVPPPVPRLQIADANGFPTASFQEWCQFMWSAIQGGGGVVDNGTVLERLFSLAYTQGGASSTTINISGGTPIRGSVSKLAIVNGGTPATQTAISCDEIVMETVGGAIFKASSVSLLTSTGASGLNGIDTGAVAASTFYFVWVISDGATVAGLLSTSATSPTLPGGYTYYARVGAVLTDGASHLVNITQKGNQARYVGATLPVMDTSPQGSILVPTWQGIATGAFVPTTASIIHFNIVISGANAVAIAAPNTSYGAYNTIVNNPPVVMVSFGAADFDSRMVSFLLESTTIYWASTGANNKVTCYGWTDNL